MVIRSGASNLPLKVTLHNVTRDIPKFTGTSEEVSEEEEKEQVDDENIRKDSVRVRRNTTTPARYRSVEKTVGEKYGKSKSSEEISGQNFEKRGKRGGTDVFQRSTGSNKREGSLRLKKKKKKKNSVLQQNFSEGDDSNTDIEALKSRLVELENAKKRRKQVDEYSPLDIRKGKKARRKVLDEGSSDSDS